MSLRTFVELAVRLHGEAFSLAARPYLDAVYRSCAQNLVIRASRQVEKSTFLANLIVYEAYHTPNLQILFVCPRLEQSLLFSHSRLQPVILNSPTIRRRLWPNKRRMPVRDIRFQNGSSVFVRAAFHSGDACRGISADELYVDEFQDLAAGSLPVLQETLSHSKRARTILTGTPKMIDNALETAFRQSTACEWWVCCDACGQSLVLDERVLGLDALRCFHCQAQLNPRNGRWIAGRPESTWGDGFSISHLMVPWLTAPQILEKQRTYDRAKFVNEVLGLPTTLGDHIITREELERCCGDWPFAGSLDDIGHSDRANLVAGIDWGGGSNSGTMLVIGHPLGERGFRVVRFHRWLPHTDPDTVLVEVTNWCKRFRLRLIAADGLGNGLIYNRMLLKNLVALGQRAAIYSIQ